MLEAHLLPGSRKMKTFKNAIKNKLPGWQRFIEFLPIDFSICCYCRNKVGLKTRFAGSWVNSFNNLTHQGSGIIY